MHKSFSWRSRRDGVLTSPTAWGPRDYGPPSLQNLTWKLPPLLQRSGGGARFPAEERAVCAPHVEKLPRAHDPFTHRKRTAERHHGSCLLLSDVLVKVDCGSSERIPRPSFTDVCDDLQLPAMSCRRISLQQPLCRVRTHISLMYLIYGGRPDCCSSSETETGKTLQSYLQSLILDEQKKPLWSICRFSA